MHRSLHRFLLPIAAVVLLVSTGCATNPATGRSQLNLYSEAQEIQIGQQADPQIVAQHGLYDDPELARYVDRIGQGLAANSERPGLPWTFRVLDDPVVNAFALPGGYIYVTRGILAHMNSEAELAAVLGHEIGHVTGQHGVNRMSKAQFAQIGIGVGAILAPDVARQVGGLAQTGMQLLFLQYGRDDEREADALGFRYADRGGYPPGAFVDMFAMLGASGRVAGQARLPTYLTTHPHPEERQRTAQQRVDQAPPEVRDRPYRRGPFLDRIDGIPFGPDPDQGFFVGRAFVHPDLRLRIELPDGWTGYNQRDAVIAMSPEKNAMIQLTLADEPTVDAAARAFYSQEGLNVEQSWRDDSRGMALQATRLFSAGQGTGKIFGAAGFVEDSGRVYRLLALAQPAAWRKSSNTMEASLESLGALRDRRYLDLDPMRVEL
ncbi:MAG: M48 family metallopeptidase, partial [Acidobacteriota bacterium]